MLRLVAVTAPTASDDERAAAADLSVVEGYAAAVDLLGGPPTHDRLAWFVEGLANARVIAGLPPVALSSTPRTRHAAEAQAAKSVAHSLYRIAARLPLDSELRGELLKVSAGYRALANLRGVRCSVEGTP